MSNCSVYGYYHNYVLLCYRPWRRLFRKTVYLQCVYCRYQKRSPEE
jgi:hypothetical protein